jgi:hypothetical protein
MASTLQFGKDTNNLNKPIDIKGLVITKPRAVHEIAQQIIDEYKSEGGVASIPCDRCYNMIPNVRKRIPIDPCTLCKRCYQETRP